MFEFVGLMFNVRKRKGMVWGKVVDFVFRVYRFCCFFYEIGIFGVGWVMRLVWRLVLRWYFLGRFFFGVSFFYLLNGSIYSFGRVLKSVRVGVRFIVGRLDYVYIRCWVYSFYLFWLLFFLRFFFLGFRERRRGC